MNVQIKKTWIKSPTNTPELYYIRSYLRGIYKQTNILHTRSVASYRVSERVYETKSRCSFIYSSFFFCFFLRCCRSSSTTLTFYLDYRYVYAKIFKKIKKNFTSKGATGSFFNLTSSTVSFLFTCMYASLLRFSTFNCFLILRSMQNSNQALKFFF